MDTPKSTYNAIDLSFDGEPRGAVRSLCHCWSGYAATSSCSMSSRGDSGRTRPLFRGERHRASVVRLTNENSGWVIAAS